MTDYTKNTDFEQLPDYIRPEYKRNIEIATKALNGKSYTELSIEYGLATSRIGQIVRKWKPYVLSKQEEGNK